MANRLKNFGRWIKKKRPFRVEWFAKDPQQKLAPEEALFNMPEPMSEKLIEAANRLPIPAKAKKVVMDELQDALNDWRSRPHASANSLVIMADPVSSVSRILTSSLNELRAKSEKASLDVSILDWVERPAKVNTIKQQIKNKLKLSEEDLEPTADSSDSQDSEAQTGEVYSGEDEPFNSSLLEEDPSGRRNLIVVPNLCWCFLRSADGLDGLDYMQELLPRDRAQFWAIGTGIVGWEYLKSTLKFHAYCGKTVHLPALSGEDLQAWLTPLIEEFDIRFSNAALHKRLQDQNHLFDLDFDGQEPLEMLSEITQEVSASVQSSVRSLKDEVLQHDASLEEDTPKRDFFERLTVVSDGVSEVALQLFIKSLRYREVNQVVEDPTTEDDRKGVVLEEVSASDSKKERTVDAEEPEENSSESADTQKAHRLIATTPKLPFLPELSQSDLYLLYSLMLHGDMTVTALAESLGDSPNVVTNQVQVLRNQGIIEQRERVLKVNAIHYPKVRRELAKNNFIIEVP